MPHHHSDDDFDDDGDREDEHWHDDEDDDSENETTAPCPDCGAPIYLLADACPARGYWLTEDDRRALDPKSRKPAWLTITTWVLIAAFLVGMLGVVGFLF